MNPQDSKTKRRPVLFNLTHFINDPTRTGIQRVCYEVLRNWPYPEERVPIRIHLDGSVDRLPSEWLNLYAEFFDAPTQELAAIAKRLKPEAKRQGRLLKPQQFRDYRALIHLEMSNDPPTLKFLNMVLNHGLHDWLFVLAYDFLPWLRPEFFPHDSGQGQYGYLQILRQVRHLGYISEQTKQDWQKRILRQTLDTGPVFPLGADGMGTAPPEFDSTSRRFTVVGTIEPRKNHLAVLDAFEKLWADGVHAELAFAGRLGWIREDQRRRLQSLRANQPLFHWHDSLNDAALLELIRSSRATIYPAWCEGYGLPPLESLALGKPVIVTESLPSVQMIPAHGQIRLPIPNAEAIRHAVLRLLDNDFARESHEQIRSLSLPQWNQLGPMMASWIEHTHN